MNNKTHLSPGRTETQRSVLEILVLQALIFHAQNRRDDAFAVLERALTLAAPEGYIRIFVDEGKPMLALLEQIQAHGIVSEHTSRLLSAFSKSVSVSAFSHQSCRDTLVEPLTERELDVLRLLVAGSSNAAIAQKLVITVGTVKRHINRIYGKLGVQSRTQAAARVHFLHIF